MTGWPVAWKCFVACLFFDESQQPTWPQVLHIRRLTQLSPDCRHSSHPSGVPGSTSRIWSRWLHPSVIALVLSRHRCIVGPTCRIQEGERRHGFRFLVIPPYHEVMTNPILRTKLYVPPPRPPLVPRPRLLERLEAGATRKLTLVSAPAGVVKPTVVSTWIATRQHPAAWLSLDAQDHDIARFLTYLVAALKTIDPAIGERVSGELREAQPPPADTILTALINDLSELDTLTILVLDDYHLVDSPQVDDALPGLPDGPPAAAGPSRRHDAGGPATAAVPATSAGRDHRAAGQRPSLHARRSRRLPQRRDGAGAFDRRCGDAGHADRGLDRGIATGGTLDARP